MNYDGGDFHPPKGRYGAFLIFLAIGLVAFLYGWMT